MRYALPGLTTVLWGYVRSESRSRNVSEAVLATSPTLSWPIDLLPLRTRFGERLLHDTLAGIRSLGLISWTLTSTIASSEHLFLPKAMETTPMG